jgi:hypothetical protein
MDRRNFLGIFIASLLPVISNTAKTTTTINNPNSAQDVFKLKYMPPCGETWSSILVRSSSDKIIDIKDIVTSTVENLPNKIKKILKDLKQQYPKSRFIFENNFMVYNRDEYDQLAETTLENLLKPSEQSRRELLSKLSRQAKI